MSWLSVLIVICSSNAFLKLTSADCSVQEDDSQVSKYACNLSEELLLNSPYPQLSILGKCSLHFQIRPDTKLYFRSTIDREAFANHRFCKCQQENLMPGKCVINLLVQLKNEVKTVRVTIIDVNDNNPEFHEKGSLILKIRENEPVGTKLVLPAATDSDIGEAKRITYSLKGPNATVFEVNYDTISKEVKLKTLKSFDRETDHWLKLTLVASDEDNRRGELDVRIEILEINDNAPRFDKSGDVIYLRESTKIGEEFHTVLVKDKDAEQKVKLFIPRSASKKVLDRFSVSSANDHHKIRLIGPLDYDEDDHEYIIPLIAEDSGNPPRSSSATLTVNVLDDNDNPPHIQTSSRLLNVKENEVQNEPLAMLFISDKDSDNNGKFGCSIRKTAAFSKFALSSPKQISIDSSNTMMQYDLYARDSFDREKDSRYNLTILCEDRGIPRLTSSMDLTVNVLDANDEAPKFNQSGYTATIRENMQPGSHIITLKAFDKDAYPHNKVVYSIPQGHNEVMINPSTGEITSATSYDREKISEFTFECVATDANDSSKFDKTTVNVKISDENDNAPYFEKNFYFKVQENSKSRHIGLIVAKDKDTGVNADIIYILKGDSAQSNLWGVRRNGEIFLKSYHSLDREKQSSYDLYIEARDQGHPAQSSTTTVQILVEDVNDNEPQFSMPPNKHEVINVTFDTPLQTIIYKVQAEDRDTGENARLVFDLNEQSGHALFVIDPTTGDIRLNRSLSRERFPSARLTITARDNGKPRRSSMAYLNVNFINGNKGKMHNSGLDKMVNRYGLSREIILGIGIGLIFIILFVLLIVVACFCLSFSDQQTQQSGANKYSDKCSTDEAADSNPSNNRRPLSLIRMFSRQSNCLRFLPGLSNNSNLEDVAIEEQKNPIISKPVMKHNNSGDFLTGVGQESVLYTHLEDGSKNCQLVKAETASLAPYGEWAGESGPPAYDRYWMYGNDAKNDPYYTHRAYTKLTGSNNAPNRLFATQTLPSGSINQHNLFANYANKSEITDHGAVASDSTSSDELKRILRFPVTMPPDSTYTTTNTDSDLKLNCQNYATHRGMSDLRSDSDFNPALQSFGKNVRRAGYVAGSPSFTSSFV